MLRDTVELQSLLLVAVMLDCAQSRPLSDGILQVSVQVDSFLNTETFLSPVSVVCPADGLRYSHGTGRDIRN